MNLNGKERLAKVKRKLSLKKEKEFWVRNQDLMMEFTTMTFNSLLDGFQKYRVIQIFKKTQIFNLVFQPNKKTIIY